MSSHLVHICSALAVRTVVVDAPAHAKVGRVIATVIDGLTAHEDSMPITRSCGFGASEAQAHHEWGEWTASTPATVVFTRRPPPDAYSGGVLVTVLAGPDAGRVTSPPPEQWTIGRTETAQLPLADPYLGRTALRVCSSADGFTIAGQPFALPAHGWTETIVGSSRLLFSTPGASRDHDGHTVHSSSSVDWPDFPQIPEPEPPSWLVYAVPALIGVVLALVTGMWWFLLFSLTGPLTAVVTRFVDRRRRNSRLYEAARTFRTAARRCDEALAVLSAGHAASSRLRWANPDRRPAAGSGSTSATVPLGYGTVALEIPLHVAEPSADQRRLRLPTAPSHPLVERDEVYLPVVHDVPVECDLSTTSLWVEGSQDAVLGMLRTVLMSIDLSVAVEGGENTPVTRLLDLVEPAAPAASKPGALPAAADVLHVTVHAAGFCTYIGPPAAAEPARRWRLHCGTDSAQLMTTGPADSDAYSPAGSGPAASAEPLALALSGPLQPRYIGAVWFATKYRRWRGVQPVWTEPIELAELPWNRPPRKADSPETLAVPVGRGPDGTVFLDLLTDGPHALVAGMTGSGKSVFLQAWIVALARALPAESLRFVLIDFKGGAAFTPLADLPHVDSITSDLSMAAAIRALSALRAEIRRREALLAADGAADITELNSRRPDSLPRLVVVIDEFQALLDDDPDQARTLESLTALGRSLGIHIVLATQRPAGVITSRMKANIALRICLRVRDAQDSAEVVETDDAANLDPVMPGLAVLSTGARTERFRSAHVAFAHALDTARRVDVTDPVSGDISRLWLQATDVPTIPPIFPQLAAQARPACRPIVGAPLPTLVHDGDPCTLGITEHPISLTRGTWRLSPGAIIVTGGRGLGRTTALCTVLAAARAHDMATVLVTADGGELRRAAQTSTSTSTPEHSADFTIGHDQPHLLTYLATLLRTHPVSRPLLIACDDWDGLSGRAETAVPAENLEQALSAVQGPVSFVVGADRRVLSGPLAARAPVRLVFPPAVAADAVYFGLRPDRFTGSRIPGRGVLLGISPDTDGLDVQVALPRTAGPASPAALRAAFGLPEPGASPGGKPDTQCDADGLTYSGPVEGLPPAPPILLGHGPLGEPIFWEPGRHGPILTVWIPATEHQRGEALVGRLFGRGRDHQPNGSVPAPAFSPPDAGTDAGATKPCRRAPIPWADAADARAEELCADPDGLACVLRAYGEQARFGSAVSRAERSGPHLALWPRTVTDLVDSGLRHVSVPTGCDGWYVSPAGSVPVTLVQ